jgi:hypothetical protein
MKTDSMTTRQYLAVVVAACAHHDVVDFDDVAADAVGGDLDVEEVVAVVVDDDDVAAAD